MKRNIKRAAAFALAMTLMSTSAYAATPTKTISTTEQTAEQGLPVLTYEEALEKVRAHDVSLRNLVDQNEALRKTKSNLWDVLGGFDQPDYEYTNYVDVNMYSYYTTVQSIENGLESSKYAKELLNLSAELSVLSTFTTINLTEQGYELAKESYALTEEQYKQGVVKNKLGLLSNYELGKLQNALDQAKLGLEKTAYDLDDLYNGLNDLMGEPTDKRYVIDYEVAYEPYELKTMTLEEYIQRSYNNDYSIKSKEVAVESARFNKNVVTESSDSTGNPQNAYNLIEANRALKSAKEDKAAAIRSAYLGLQQADIDYTTAVAELEKLKEDLRVVQVNFNAGYVTQLALDGAELAVKAQEMTISQLAHTYKMQVFMFENTSILSGGSSGGNYGGSGQGQ